MIKWLRIRLFVVPLISTLALAGCVGTQYAYKPGATISTKDNDSFRCELAATQNVPTNTQIGTNPVFVSPATTTCTGYSCYTTGGQVSGGDVYSYDANNGLRSEFFAKCMINKGYKYTEIPVCTLDKKISPQLKSLLSGRLRPPKEGACAISITNRASNLLYDGES